MVEEDRYCVEVLIQIDAARGALREVSQLVLRNYLTNCVNRAIGEGDPDIYDELLGIMHRLDKESTTDDLYDTGERQADL